MLFPGKGSITSDSSGVWIYGGVTRRQIWAEYLLQTAEEPATVYHIGQATPPAETQTDQAESPVQKRKLK